MSRYFRIQRNQAKGDERELSEKLFEENKLIMKCRLNGRIRIMVIITWAVSLMRCGTETVKWTKSELDELD